MYHTFKLGCLYYCDDDGDMSVNCFWKVLNSEGVKITNSTMVMGADFFSLLPEIYTQNRWQSGRSWWDICVCHTLRYGFPDVVWIVYVCPSLRGHIGRSLATMDKVCNIFFSVGAFLLVHASRCAQEYYPQTSLSSLFSALWGPPLQKNNVLEGKPNQCTGDGEHEINSVFFSYLI